MFCAKRPKNNSYTNYLQQLRPKPQKYLTTIIFLLMPVSASRLVDKWAEVGTNYSHFANNVLVCQLPENRQGNIIENGEQNV